MMRFIYVTLALLLHSALGLGEDYTTERVLASQQVREGVPPTTLQEMRETAPNVDLLMRVFPSESWDALFPHANEDPTSADAPYTYFNLVSAAWKFPFFCGEPNQTEDECMHELTVMFAHFIQETGGNRGDENGLEDGLYWQREIDCYNPSDPHGVGTCNKRYCTEHDQWSVFPCGNRAYYGRGAKQLSHNYNYAFFSKAMTGDKNTYLLEPDRIITDGWPALASAIWFWMTPQIPKPSMHEVVTGLWVPNEHDLAAGITAGFGTTTNIINGLQECGPHAQYPQNSESRVGYYRSLCHRFEGTVTCFNEDHDDCASMNSEFSDQGKASTGPLYYLDADEVDCKPVEYQMPFVAGLDEQECKCYFFSANYPEECQTTPAPPTSPAPPTDSTPAPTTAGPVGDCVSFTAGAGTGFCHGFLAEAASQLGIEVAAIASFDKDPSDTSSGNPPLCTRGNDGTFASSPDTGLWGGVLYRVCESGEITVNPVTTAATTIVTTAATTVATTAVTTAATTVATTSVTTAVTTAATTASSPDPPIDCAAAWQQCGGNGFEDKCCEEGTQCFRNSEWYSQCRPSCPAGWECQGRRRLRGAAISS